MSSTSTMNPLQDSSERATSFYEAQTHASEESLLGIETPPESGKEEVPLYDPSKASRTFKSQLEPHFSWISEDNSNSKPLPGDDAYPGSHPLYGARLWF